MIDPAIIVVILYISAAISLLGMKIKRVNDVVGVLVTGFALFSVILNFFLLPLWLSLPNFLGFSFTINGYTNLIALIATFIGFLVVVYSIKYIENRSSYYSFFVLLTLGSLVGMAYSWNLLWIFVFAELATISSAPLIAHYLKATSYEGALKYLIIQIFASFFVVVGLGLIYQQALAFGFSGIGVFSIDFLIASGLLIGFSGKLAIFLIFIGFLVKVPSFPIHTWLPDASTAAPAPISTLLHAMMIKVAGMPAFLVLLMFYSLFISIYFWILICSLGALTMLICVIIAFAQNDLKRLLAFDSVSQMGYVILGLGIGGLAITHYTLSPDPLWSVVAAGGIAAGLFHLLNHSFFKSVLFFSAGAIEHETGTRDINKLGGLLHSMPRTGYVMLIGSLAIAGVPLLNGFASKWMVYNACIAVGQPAFAFIAIFASALTFGVFLRMLCSVFLGHAPETYADVHPAPKSMVAPSLILAAGCVLFGIFPQVALTFLIYPATIPLLPAAVPPPVSPVFWVSLDLFLLATLLFIGLVVGYILYRFRWGSQPVEADDKTMPMTGGTLRDPYLKVDEVRPSSTVFAYPFRSLLNGVRKTHTGLVNMYILWFVLFVLLLLSWLFLGWI
ncbi:MAG: NADH-quinone oxidoreductase subunit 5 family protein [Candidatus Hermodarchaeia archaeon]|jgi:multicomponent Na+:H+ antiporter subunit D